MGFTKKTAPVIRRGQRDTIAGNSYTALITDTVR